MFTFCKEGCNSYGTVRSRKVHNCVHLNYLYLYLFLYLYLHWDENEKMRKGTLGKVNGIKIWRRGFHWTRGTNKSFGGVLHHHHHQHSTTTTNIIALHHHQHSTITPNTRLHNWIESRSNWVCGPHCVGQINHFPCFFQLGTGLSIISEKIVFFLSILITPWYKKSILGSKWTISDIWGWSFF